MADSFKNSIRLGVQLDSTKDIQGKLNDVIESLNNTKINLDINILNSDVAKQLETLTSLANTFKNSLGGSVSLGNVNEVIKQALSSMEKLNGEVLKTNVKAFDDVIVVTQNISTNLNEVTKQTQKFQKMGDDLKPFGQAVTVVTEDVEKLNSTLGNIQNAQKSLDVLKSNGIINTESIDKLKSELNTLYEGINNRKETGIVFNDSDIKSYFNQVKELENEEKNLKSIQDANNKELEALYKLQQEDLKQLQQLEQQREKELQQENELIQKQGQAYQQINILKSNGIINNSDITNLEKMTRDADSLQKINSVLKSIMSTSMMKESPMLSISKQIDDSQIKLDKMKQTFGGKLPNGFADSIQSSLNKLKEELKTADEFSFNGIRNSLNQVNAEMKVTTNETQQLVNSLKGTNGGFFSGISTFLGKVGVFYGVQQVTQEIGQQFRNASNYVQTLDKNITNIQMITGKTRDEVIGLTNQFKEMGGQLHITNQEMLAGSEELMRAGYDNDTTSKMLEASSMASKISGQTTQSTTEQLIAIKNAFNMTGDNMQHVIDVISKLDNTSASSFKDISDAVMRTAFSAQQAGTPFENLSAYITTVIEKTKRSAETVGESFKSLYSRYYNIKLGNLDDDGKSINDVETAMNNVGIAIRSSKGEFKDFDVVLQEFVNKYKEGTMSQVDFMAGINALGGTRQKESILALVENFDTAKKHIEDVNSATGSAKAMYEVYSQSIEAKVSDLKRAFEGLYEKILSSDSLKWLVTEATQLVTALSQVDGKTIAFIATVGSLVVVMTKLSALNKALIAGEAVTGLSKFIAVLSGMSTVSKTIEEATVATKALQVAEAGLVAETAGLTGLKGAWVLLSTGIKEATTSAIIFMATPIGMVITAIGVALGIAIAGFTSYQKHQEELTQQSKNLKEALDGVNQALKGGDTTKAQQEVDKIKKAQQELQKYIELRKKAQDAPSTSFNPTASGTNQATVVDSWNKKIAEYQKVLTDAGYTVDETTGKIKELDEAQSKVDNQNIINGIKDQTKAQLENRENLEQAQEEFNNYISTVQTLYAEYQNLSAQETLSSEQKQQLGSVVEQLQGHISGLNVSIDENGKTYISNSGLIDANIQKLTSEGMTVDNLSAIRIGDSKVNSEWQIGNTQVTYSQINARIAMYKAEIQAIQALMQARIAGSVGGEGSQGYESMSIGKAQSMEANSEEYAQYKEKADQLREYENAKKQIDALYTGVGSVPYSGGGGAKIPSGGEEGSYTPSGGGSDKSKADAKKAEEELIKSEKQTIQDILDAYNDAKDKIENDIGEIDYNIKLLGESNDSNFKDRIDLTTQKFSKQKEEVEKAQEQLDKLKNTTVTTSEAQKTLTSETLKASKTLRDEKLAVADLEKELQKIETEQLKKYFENEKEIESQKLEATQQAQNDKLEEIKKQQEEIHNARMDALDAELTALEKQNEEEDKSNELQEKQNDLKQKQIDLDNLKSQKTIKTLKQDINGQWSYVGEVDREELEKKQKEVDEAQKSLTETKRKQEYEEAKQAIEDQKTAEEKLYKEKQDYLEKYSKNLTEQQNRDKKRMEAYYADIETLTSDTLKTLREQYTDNWTAIADSISISVERSKTELNDLKTLSANFVASDVVKAITGGDISGYLAENQDKMNQKATLDENGINGYFNALDVSASNANNSIVQLTKSYNDLASIRVNNLNISDEDISQNKEQVSRITTIDYDGLNKQLNNLKDTNNKIKTELESFYAEKLNNQNQAQDNELSSLKNFTDTYLLFTNKFLELLQVVYDYRFNNITTIVSGAVQNILEALVQTAQDYQKFAEMWNIMHGEDEQIPSSIDISDNITGNTKYQQSTASYQASKLSLYSVEAFEKYANEIGNGISESLLNRLNNYTSTNGAITNTNNSSTVNNKNTTTSSTTSVVINGVTVNADNAEQFLSSLLTKAKQTSVLKSIE